MNTRMLIRRLAAGFLIFLFLFLFLSAPPALALEPHELLVIANKDHDGSLDVARLYMQQRRIPSENLLIVRAGTAESCSREDYIAHIQKPVRHYFKRHPKISRGVRCIVLMYGLPLKILPSEKVADHRMSDRASVDSEIALVRAPAYPLGGWIPNPFFIHHQALEKLPVGKPDVLMVARIDGPTAEIARRIIADSIDAERTGLSGKVYLDARWPYPETPPQTGYAVTDYHIHQAARALDRKFKLPVILDDDKSVFKAGSDLDAALYCGWYSLRTYVDAFDWQKGSVGYHIASAECATLKSSRSQVWCKRMLEDGAAATVGPVFEPYAQAFPLPDVFFGCLADGYLALAECYLLSSRFLSWQMVLIGDPLYRPYHAIRSR